MSTWTDPETGITISRTRERRTSETVKLRAIPEVGDLYLADLRQLIERCAHLPGDALVQPVEDGINVAYVEVETAVGGEFIPPDSVHLEVDGTTIFSDEVMADLRDRLRGDRISDANSEAAS